MKYWGIPVVFAAVLLIFGACEKERPYLLSSDARLEFSVDTLRFDTVFTERGSATRYLKVYNTYENPLLISSITLSPEGSSFFRMNVDGIPGDEVRDLEILPNDSIYIFLEVTVDPNQPLSVSPFVVEDQIRFTLNGNNQIVYLEAWGQNANYIPSRFNKGVPALLTCNLSEITWDDPKPYVLFGELFIDSCTLKIPAGTRIYVHGGIAKNDLFGAFNDGILWTFEKGSLKIEGTKDNPVVIQGDRLEPAYSEEPGQWYGIRLGRGSKNNSIRYATIKNAIYGLIVDSLANVQLNNTRIYNTVGSGLIGYHGNITANNCLIYNNYSTSFQAILGGTYQFNYCTFASYGVDASAVSLSNFLCYDNPLICEQLAYRTLNASFKNCIISGSRKDELDLLDVSGGQTPALFQLRMENCIVRAEELLTEQDGLYADFFENTCLNCIQGKREDPLFVDFNEDDYHLSENSIALEKAKVLNFPFRIDIDLEGNPRDSEKPDIGCYETP